MPKTIPTLENFVNLFERAKMEGEFAEAVGAMEVGVAALEACFKKNKTLGVDEDSAGNTLLHYAARFENADLAKTCLKYYVAFNDSNKFDMKAIHIAAFNGNVSILNYLANKGGISSSYVRVKALGHELLCFELHLAILNGQLQTASYLMESYNNAQILRVGSVGNICHLMAFTRDGSHIPTLMQSTWLQKYPYLLQECSGENFYTPLMLAASIGNVSAIEGFAKLQDLDMNKASIKDGRTALHVASQSESNIKALNDVYENEVDLYPELSVLKSAEKLLECGANINAQDNLKRTPLHSAVAAGNYEMAALLLTKGADITILDGNDMSPLLLAKQLSEENNQYDNKIVSLLENPGQQKEVINEHAGLRYHSTSHMLLAPSQQSTSVVNNNNNDLSVGQERKFK